MENNTIQGDIIKTTINHYDFLCKWKELAERGEPLYDIHIPDYGTFINCKVIPEANGYTIEYSDWREDNATRKSD